MEDTYEINDSLETAYDLSDSPQTWLSELNGLGIQNNDDWYKISVEPGFERLVIDLRFTHAAGDIDLEIVDRDGEYITNAVSSTDNEYINTVLPEAGTYYLNVNLDNAGNSYDLWWDSLEFVDDTYEINDSLETAYDLSDSPRTWLSELDGLGIQNNDDWFKISVEPGFERLIADLKFDRDNGDIDLILLDENGEYITDSVSETDNEYINTILPEAGTYYLGIYHLNVAPDNAGNTYDLRWDSLEVVDDTYELNDSLEIAYDLSDSPQTWLSELDGLGIQNNDDWFKISVEPGFEELIVDLKFAHAEGDIDIEVLDEDGDLITIAESLTDNEHISTLLPNSGTYYLNVNFNNLGNTYDLKWEGIEPSLDIKGAGNFNDDSNIDLVWRSRGTGNNFAALMEETNIVESIILNPVSDTNWDIEGTGDFNDDGKSDLVWRNDIAGKNSVWLMDGEERLESISLHPVSDTNWDIEGTGDFNDDGKSDLVWRNNIAGKNSVWLMDGTERLESIPLNPVLDSNWDIKGTGDFNDDGKSDLIWRNDIVGKNSVWLMDGTERLESIPLDSI